MKKQVGNIEVERHEAEFQGEAITVYLSIRTSNIPRLNLTAADAKDLHYALGWALQKPTEEQA